MKFKGPLVGSNISDVILVSLVKQRTESSKSEQEYSSLASEIFSALFISQNVML